MTFLAFGEYAKRHVPFKPDGSVYVPQDFYFGAQITVFGRTFTVADADTETRKLMYTRYGEELGPPLPIPPTYTAPKVPVGHSLHANKVVCDMGDMEDPVNGFYRKMPDMKAKFLEHGSALLRFECEWQETGEAFGDRRSFALQYYLSDDTLEILDKSSPYSQGGQFTKFAIRQRLPRMALEHGAEAVVSPMGHGAKAPPASAVIAACAAARRRYRYADGPTVWGRFMNPVTGKPTSAPSTAVVRGGAGGATTAGGFPVLSAVPQGDGVPDFVTAADLICGGVISVFGRPLLLKSCDPFTAAFALHKLGIDQRPLFVTNPTTLASERARVMPQSVPRGPVGLPPHEGALAIGSEEETRINATKIVPTFRTANNFDRFYQLAGKCLRFEAALDATRADPDDAHREFVVSFYLEDDTLAIVEVIRDKKGARATRYLSRGKWRNAAAPPEAHVQAAVNGSRGAVPLPHAIQSAYDRVFGATGDKYGYSDSFGGQGYSGGIYGKAERTGPGNTGVAAAADIGIRDPLSHTYVAPPRNFSSDDFRVGAAVELHHMPGPVFMLGRPDGFTVQWLASREVSHGEGTADARDVYVPDSKHPVPSLSLEGVSTSSGGNSNASAAALAHTEACLTFAKILAGVAASCAEVIRQADKGQRGYAPRGVVLEALARYGCAPPAAPAAVVEYMLSTFTVGTGVELAAAAQAVENAKSTRHARPGSRAPLSAPQPPAGGSPLALSKTMARTSAGAAEVLDRTTGASLDGLVDAFAGPRLTDFGGRAFYAEPMIDYGALFKAVRDAVVRQQGVQPRLDKLVPQLRAALLSSRTHLRRVFRDLDCAGAGAITFKEFRHLLMRHQLDVGLNDAQIRALMARFEPAAPAAAAAANAGSEPAIDFRGFVLALLDASTLAPGEVEHFMDFIRGVHNMQPDGVGGTYTVPQGFPHTNAVSSWTDTMDLTRFGITEQRPASAPAAVPPPPPPQMQHKAPAKAPAFAAPPPPPHAQFAPVGGAPVDARMPGGARPSTAPAAFVDPRPSPANPVVDVVHVLRASEKGQALLGRVQSMFGSRRLDLYRSLTLYDTRRARTLGVRAFVDALVSAGLKLSMTQAQELSRSICVAAGSPGAPVPLPQDVAVDYNAFLEAAFPSVGAY